MPLNELLSAERVAILAAPLDRRGVLDAAAGLLAGTTSPPLPGMADAISESLQNRERLASTAIGYGVAIPHGRIPGIEHTRGAFIRLREAADFGAADGIPVDLVLAMAVPEHYLQEHLQQLAELAEHFADPGFRSRLRDAADLDGLRRCLLGGDAHRNAA